MGRGSDGACLLVFFQFAEDRSRRQCQRGKSQQHQEQDLQTNDGVRLEAFDANCLIGKQLLRDASRYFRQLDSRKGSQGSTAECIKYCHLPRCLEKASEITGIKLEARSEHTAVTAGFHQ